MSAARETVFWRVKAERLILWTTYSLNTRLDVVLKGHIVSVAENNEKRHGNNIKASIVCTMVTMPAVSKQEVGRRHFVGTGNDNMHQLHCNLIGLKLT